MELDKAYDISTEFAEDLMEDLKDNYEPPKTRSKHGSRHVLEYQTGSFIDLHGSSYFHKILQRHNKAIRSEEVGNFVLNMSLPLPVLGSIDMLGRNRFGKKKLIPVFGKTVPPVEEILAGSLSEGLSLPEVKHIKSKDIETEIPDEDWKYVCNGLSVSFKKQNSFATLEHSTGSPCAFVKLRLNKDFKKKLAKHEQLKPESFISGDGLIDRDRFISNVKQILRVHIGSFSNEGQTVICKDGQEPTVEFSKHGPATTVEVKGEDKTTFSSDLVICLPVCGWPEPAKDWPKRKRVWPSVGVVNKIRREGCHIVGKGHKGSKDEKYQFIFSFSLCDKTLSKAMSLNQKRCYMLFKFVFKYYLNKIPRGLTSFCCKVTFLWMCEAKPQSEWADDTLLDCLIGLVSKMKEFLISRHLPHFYIPEFNLIEEMTDAAKDVCVRDINRYLENPVDIFLNLTETHRFIWLSSDISLVEILEPVISRRGCGQDIAISSSVLAFFSHLLDKGEGLLVLSIVCKDWRWTSNVESNTSQCIQNLEQMIDLLKGSGNMVCLQGLLGNLYHQLAYKTGNTKYSNKADNILWEAQAIAGRHTWVYACCYDSLMYDGMHDIVLRHFLTCLRDENVYTEGIYTALTNYNCYTGFNLAETFGYAHVPTTAYILFQVISCYIALSQKSHSPYKRWLLQTEAVKVLKHLWKWSIRKCNLYPGLFDDQLNFVVGLSANIAGERDIAVKAYQESMSYGRSVLAVDLGDIGHVSVVPDYLLARPRGRFDKKSLRFQPYRRAKRGQRVGLAKNLVFADSIPRVGKYVHN